MHDDHHHHNHNHEDQQQLRATTTGTKTRAKAPDEQQMTKHWKHQQATKNKASKLYIQIKKNYIINDSRQTTTNKNIDKKSSGSKIQAFKEEMEQFHVCSPTCCKKRKSIYHLSLYLPKPKTGQPSTFTSRVPGDSIMRARSNITSLSDHGLLSSETCRSQKTLSLTKGSLLLNSKRPTKTCLLSRELGQGCLWDGNEKVCLWLRSSLVLIRCLVVSIAFIFQIVGHGLLMW